MNEVNEQQIPNLEEMNEQEAHRFLAELLSNLSPEEEYDVRHQDYVMEMPQSGERFRGRENMRAFQRARGDHATPPRSLRLRRVLVEEGLWVVEAVIERATSPEPTNGMPKTALPSGRNPASASGARRTCWRSRKAFPASVEFEVRRVIGRPDLGVSEYVIRYDGKPVSVIGIIKFEGGKVVRETGYFAQPFEPHEWRARWVGRMEA